MLQVDITLFLNHLHNDFEMMYGNVYECIVLWRERDRDLQGQVLGGGGGFWEGEGVWPCEDGPGRFFSPSFIAIIVQLEANLCDLSVPLQRDWRYYFVRRPL